MTVDVGKVLAKLGVTAKLAGPRWRAESCPLPEHANPNPAHRWQNFSVVAAGPLAGQYHCWSCKGGGGLVDLVVILRKIDTGDSRDDRRAARKWLAEVDVEAAAQPNVRIRYIGGRYDFRMPAGFEQPAWEGWNSVAREYAVRRGIVAGQVERWGIGYALEGRLEGRIVVPVRARGGRLANYAARTFVGDEVRYLAASAGEGPDTGVMFGEVDWPADPAKRGTVVLFEGAINGLAIERAARREPGFPLYLAGMSGSRIDHRMAGRLAGWRRIVVATDPDRAGEMAYAAAVASLAGPAARRRCEVVRLRYRGGVDAADTPPEELAEELFDAARRRAC